MWRKLQSNSSYFISITNKDVYEIFVTDYLTLWFVKLSEDDFLRSLKESNSTLEIEDLVLREKGIKMITTPNGVNRVEKIKLDGQTVVLTISISYGYTLKLILKLIESSKEMFFQKVTQPLLQMIQNLKSSETELRESLKRKDIEICKYRSGGGRVPKHIRTARYNDDAHMNKHKVYENHFGVFEIPNCLLEKTVCLPESTVKCEPIEIKMEANETIQNIKAELETQFESQNATITATVNVKREMVKTELAPRDDDPRKRRRAKLNI